MQIEKKYIDFGTGSKEVNSRDLPANFTPSNYTPDQVASEGADKVSAHLKGIDTALASAGSGSAGDISETSFSLTNNQATPANVTGLAFANATVRGTRILITVEIDATADLYETFTIVAIQKGSDWDYGITSVGDNSGVEFSMTASGQVQYISDNYSGFVSGKIKFRAETTTVG